MVGIEQIKIGNYMIAEPQYLLNRKTPIYNLCSSKNELIHLGQVKWNSQWRKYCFYPIDYTVFDNKCLRDLIDFLEQLNINKKESK